MVQFPEAHRGRPRGRGEARLPEVRGKGDKDRLVPLAPALARRLRRFAEKTRKETNYERIFISLRRRPGSGEYRPITPSGLSQLVHVLADEAGITNEAPPQTDEV